MSKAHTELAERRLPKRFQQRAKVLAGFAVCIFAATQVHALTNSFSATETVVQTASEVRRPQAKSDQERKDFNAAYALTNAAGAEAAANDFADKYPDSELRHYLYSSAMLLYQRENNSAKMLTMAEKVLELDADNSLALVLTATALADELGDRDRDREHKIGMIKRNATRGIQAAETSYASGADGAGQVYKSTLQAMAYSALGIMKLKTGDDAGAEKDLSTAADLAKIHPDPYVWYHLALAQDHRKKYAAALSSVEQALQLASSDPDLQKLAEVEHERLAGLTKGPSNGETPEPQ